VGATQEVVIVLDERLAGESYQKVDHRYMNGPAIDQVFADETGGNGVLWYQKPKLTEKDITGLKYFDQIAPLLQRLHDDACDRDTAGNRILHYDQYCMLLLLYFFNPIITSLRGLQQASELKNVQAKLGCA